VETHENALTDLSVCNQLQSHNCGKLPYCRPSAQNPAAALAADTRRCITSVTFHGVITLYQLKESAIRKGL
jgi:hypothetical protein